MNFHLNSFEDFLSKYLLWQLSKIKYNQIDSCFYLQSSGLESSRIIRRVYRIVFTYTVEFTLIWTNLKWNLKKRTMFKHSADTPGDYLQSELISWFVWGLLHQLKYFLVIVDIPSELSLHLRTKPAQISKAKKIIIQTRTKIISSHRINELKNQRNNETTNQRINKSMNQQINESTKIQSQTKC